MGLMLNSKTVGGAAFKSSSIAGMILGGKVIWQSVPPFSVAWTITGSWNATGIKSVGDNIYVVASDDDSLISYDSTGAVVWKWSSGQSGYKIYLATDSNQQFYVLSYDSTNWFIKIIDKNGNALSEFNISDRPYYMDADNSNVYIATSTGVEKLDDTGAQVWKWTSSATQSVTVDSEGNVYAGGSAGVTKLDSSGNQLWQWQSSGVIASVAVDSDGNVYSGGWDNCITKLDSSGKQVWQCSSSNAIYFLTTDSEGNVYAVDSSGYVIKFSSGKQVWQWKGSASANKVAVDSNFNVYVGCSNGNITKLAQTK